MTKAELVGVIARETGKSSKDVNEVLESFFSNVKSTMQNGDEVIIRGFGTFAVKHRGEKKARNISKGTEIIIPAKDVPSFKPSKQFFDN